MNRKSLLALVGVLSAFAVGGAAVGLARPRRAPPAPPPAAAPPGQVVLPEVPEFVRVAPVQVTTDGGATQATGKVAFDEGHVSRVGAPVSGRIVELSVQPGDRVRRGQGLLVIASPDAGSAVADWVAATSDADVAGKALERQRRLFADQAVPYKEVLQAESDATKARAAVARARARLEVLGIDPGQRDPGSARYVLRSPIDGIVVERPASPGMEVRADAGTPLLTVADLTRLWVLADVYERDLGAVSVGQRAELRVAAYPARTFEGRVTHIGELVDPQSHTVKVRVEVRNDELLLKPEMFARVTLHGGLGQAVLTVPSEAVLTDGAATAVMVALAGGRFEKRTVESGPEQEGRVRVLSGLAPGDRVVVDGAIYLEAAAEGME